MTKLVAAALALSATTPALARQVGSVEFAETVTVGGTKLALNGAGFRKKFDVLKIYAGALYLPQRSRDPEAIVEADQPRLVRMVFTRRVSKVQIMDAYRDGFERNSPGPGLYDLLAHLETIRPAIPEQLENGAEMVVSYVPGEGTTVRSSGVAKKVTVKSKEFADAMLRLWLGREPADVDLKKAMLAGR